MYRLAPALLVLILLAPASAAPRLKEKKADTAPLAGTSWAGKTAEGWDMTIDFAADGKMTVSYNKASYTSASWKQDGDRVYYEMNNRYREFNGKLAGDTIDGESQNVRGRKWSTTLTRVRDR